MRLRKIPIRNTPPDGQPIAIVDPDDEI